MGVISTKFTLFGLAVLMLVAVQSCGRQPVTLTHAPDGYVFTDVEGNQVSLVPVNTLVQLRTGDRKNVVFQFVPREDVDFKDVVIEKDTTAVWLHFAAPKSLSGVSLATTVFSPCNPMQNAVRICPDASDLSSVKEGCSNEVILSQNTLSSNHYTWANPGRSGTEACEIRSDLAQPTLAASGTTMMPYYFSFKAPMAYEGGTKFCSLACDDPIVTFDGISRGYSAVEDLGLLSITDTLVGKSIKMNLQHNAPDYVTRYIPHGPSSQLSFQAGQNAFLDLHGYNFLLPNQQTHLVECAVQCERFDNMQEGSLEFNLNGTQHIRYTVTGYDTDNVYFMNPESIDPLYSGLDGGAQGTDAFVIIKPPTLTQYSFALGQKEFAKVKGFEILDLDNGIPIQVTLDAKSIYAFSDTGELRVLGTALDTVILSDMSDWIASPRFVTYKGRTLKRYVNGKTSLLLETSIQVKQE